MKPRMTIVADSAGGSVTVAPTPPPAPAPVEVGGAARFHALMIVEGIQTGDKRIFSQGALTWPQDLVAVQVALTADDENHMYHEDAKLVGNFDRIERRGDEIHGWGDYIENPDDDAARLIGLIQSGELRGISVDVDQYEEEILFPTSDDQGQPLEPIVDFLAPADAPAIDQTPPVENIDGVDYEVVPMQEPIERVTLGRIRGACALMFPAFVEAFIEPDTGTGIAPALAASAAPELRRYHLTGIIVDGNMRPPPDPVAIVADGRFSFPDIPPREWFYVPEPAQPMALTILDSGQMMGHLAKDGECHIGFSGECVTAPYSPSNYGRFHLGEIPVSDGGRVSVGHLTFHTGHADRSWGARETVSHYDNSGTVAADIRAVDGEHGVWVCGAMKPGLSAAQVREVMSCPPSGDWRVFGGEHDMVAALAVPVPGFQNTSPRVYVARNELGMVASMIFVNPVAPTRFVGARDVSPQLSRRIGDLIAASIGRSKKDRVAALSVRVHGG